MGDAAVSLLVPIAAAADDDSRGRDVLGVLVLLALIAGGAWLWSTGKEHAKAQARITEAKARDAEAADWRRATRWATTSNPGPPAPLASPLTPDRGPRSADQARRAIQDALIALAASIAEEARAHADALGSDADRWCRPGRFRERSNYEWGPARDGTRLTRSAFARVLDIMAWADARRRLLSGVHDDAARLLVSTTSPCKNKLGEFRDTSRWVGDGEEVPVLPHDRWPAFLGDLHAALTSIADDLPALPPPEPPIVHRPGEAKLREDVSAEAMTGQLDAFLTRVAALREAAAEWPFDMGGRLDGGVLDGFVTREIRDRLAKATPGFEAVARWKASDIAPAARAHILLAYLDIALGYLTEVRGNMDKYAQDSGTQPGDRITVFVDTNHGNVNVKSSIGTINTTLAPVDERGDTELAEAIRALGEAARNDPDLTDERRQEVLHHVEDIAEAAAEPGEERKRSRAKAALAAVTDAAKGAAQLAQTVDSWHDVIGKLF
ncbi:hypothetical protein [Amycolatopsis sp. MtRt-6]|uniref:hypothetical protein n=1 Tax=Amycolatopsis sp. MtRt-6 TaxID=2792782 RepID=UPI001A8C5772|nr:hypothetical protein [Amycolatopsis sp. MtRt-6]